jgi:hypothetical protein
MLNIGQSAKFRRLTKHGSATSSPAPSTRTAERPLTPAQQIVNLQYRVGELTTQSSLNQALCPQLLKDLLDNQAELAQQTTLNTQLQAFIRESDGKHSSQVALLQQVVQSLSRDPSDKQQTIGHLERHLSYAQSVATRLERTVAEYHTNRETVF